LKSRRDLVLDQVLAGRRCLLDRAGRRDVVGGDRIAEEQAQHARADDVGRSAGSIVMPSK
jgi:hypothetical protein